MMTMMIMMMLMMMMWKDDADGALDPWSCLGHHMLFSSNQFSHFKSSIQNHPNRHLFCNPQKTSKVFNYTESW